MTGKAPSSWQRADSIAFGVYWWTPAHTHVIVRPFIRYEARTDTQRRKFWRLKSAQKWLDELKKENRDPIN